METQNSLADEFFALTSEQRRLIHFILCEHALERWNSFANAHTQIEYIETVVGTRQEVDKNLPSDALAAARQGIDSLRVAKRYLEPITALQDDDLIFPKNVTFAYYAIYNLFNKYAKKEVVDDWLIVNQALSSENGDEVWNAFLKSAIEMAKR